YEFSVLPAEVLGQVYEQFLGKVIRLTPAHRAVVEEKPEVKKAGGVYYTPAYIVDYIVEQTVGVLVEGRSPRQLRESQGSGGRAPLRVLDPACGSGSFLLGAYQYLLDHYLGWYAEDGPEKHAGRKDPALYQGPKGDWRLTSAERKRILLDHIYGVDIDRQAVEVTKLSLLLQVLEGETDETLGQQLSLWRERALPDLGDNIKCGNSLIGPDYFEGTLMPDEEECRRVNPFDWEAEFPEAMGVGGFDAVIGNPPYVRMEEFKEAKGYLKSHFCSHDERSDLYVYFIERGLSLLRTEGYFGMIVSNKFLRAKYGRSLRQHLAEHVHLVCIADFAGLPVFAGATVRTVVLVAAKLKVAPDDFMYTPPVDGELFARIQGGSETVQGALQGRAFSVAVDSLDDDVWSLLPPAEAELLAQLQSRSLRLSDHAEFPVFRGVVSGLTKAFVIGEDVRNEIIRVNHEATEILKPFVNGRDIRRYQVSAPGLFLIYTYRGVPIERYPAVKEHLRPYRSALLKRATKQAWYELQQPQRNFAKHMENPKIVFPDIATEPRFALDSDGHFGSNTAYFIAGADLYLLGLLNSRISRFYFSRKCAALEGPGQSYLRFFGQYLEGFPVHEIDFDDATDAARHDGLVALVEQMLDLHGRLAAASIPDDRTQIQRQIDATDRAIDALVYELYGLSEEEVAIVEGATG
ncbi:Eco57I restriction-modification methylase domain-containing protein, partial [Chloroflexota bacterium]